MTDTNISHFATWSVPIGWYIGARGGNLTENLSAPSYESYILWGPSQAPLISLSNLTRKEPFGCQYTRQDNLSPLVDSRF
jgi:hypothetical protein